MGLKLCSLQKHCLCYSPCGRLVFQPFLNFCRLSNLKRSEIRFNDEQPHALSLILVMEGITSTLCGGEPWVRASSLRTLTLLLLTMFRRVPWLKACLRTVFLPCKNVLSLFIAFRFIFLTDQQGGLQHIHRGGVDFELGAALAASYLQKSVAPLLWHPPRQDGLLGGPCALAYPQDLCGIAWQNPDDIFSDY
jgi:hypothetical protein